MKSLVAALMGVTAAATVGWAADDNAINRGGTLVFGLTGGASFRYALTSPTSKTQVAIFTSATASVRNVALNATRSSCAACTESGRSAGTNSKS